VKPHLQKISRAKWTGGAAQAVERLFASMKPQVKKKKSQKNKRS
jgi:hypothetical protein